MKAWAEAFRRASAPVRSLTLQDDLQQLPSELFDHAETLEVLDIGGNRLTTLPPQFARLTKLRVLFASGNPFERLPPVLGELPVLSQLGFRGCHLREVPGEALPLSLRWLTLTDNAIAALPAALGDRPQLQKLMLSGNRLRHLPESLAAADRLELIRLAANDLQSLPSWLPDLQALAWAGWAANPFEQVRPPAAVRAIPANEATVGELLGEGASGRVYAARWRPPAGVEQSVAVKVFKGAMTSDGLPEHEMAACLAAGDHPGLAGALGKLDGGDPALLTPLLPAEWRVLAAPPDAHSCSRDVYAAGQTFTPEAVLRITSDVAGAVAHLHARGLMHGDLYAHNILWNGSSGAAVLTDFGAATFLPADQARWTRLEVLAFGRLLGELITRTDAAPAWLQELRILCTSPDPGSRPGMVELAALLGGCGVS